ncbi:MAG: ABC transporter permease [Anaeromyxobacter sp.]
MNPLVTLRVALRALVRNKTRSVLTTLGVVIGVAAVIATVGIGNGAAARVADTFAAMGTNLLIVLPGSLTSGGAQGGMGSASTITWDDLTAIRSELPSVRAAAPQLRSGAQLVAEGGNWQVQLSGTTPEFFQIRSWRAARGRLLEDGDVDARAQVIVLGRTTADELFGKDVDPVGEVVRVRSVPFTIVGVLEKKGQSPMGQDYDDTALVPATTFQARIQGSLSGFLDGALLVSATSSTATQRAQDELTALLRDRHRLAEGDDDDFSVRNLAELASSQQQSARTMATLLASVAAVSLLVGGIGIMNIMLVSVTERTREIGIRAAVGATPGNLLAQFLAEAVALSVLGGAVGVALGMGLCWQLGSAFGWKALVDAGTVLIAIGFSAFVGVTFGLYPALRASRLDPIVALRWE